MVGRGFLDFSSCDFHLFLFFSNPQETLVLSSYTPNDMFTFWLYRLRNSIRQRRSFHFLLRREMEFMLHLFTQLKSVFPFFGDKRPSIWKPPKRASCCFVTAAAINSSHIFLMFSFSAIFLFEFFSFTSRYFFSLAFSGSILPFRAQKRNEPLPHMDHYSVIP